MHKYFSFVAFLSEILSGLIYYHSLKLNNAFLFYIHRGFLFTFFLMNFVIL